MVNKKFKFSVIIPIYNTELYLEEAIESIINQTIGFEDNIQLILVNDGSQDNSEEICLKYKEKYPNNVVYVKQKNSGVSVARNNGLKYIKGDYVNFLDSDDKWALDAFEIAYNFMQVNKVDIVVCRYNFFDKITGYRHPLDYRFQKTRVVNIFNEYNCINKSVSAAFMKSDLIKDHQFDSRLKTGEDLKLYTDILISEKIDTIGIIREAEYMYRKRDVQNSATDSILKDGNSYLDTLKYCFLPILMDAKKTYGYIPDYYQYLVLDDLQYRMKQDSSNILKDGLSEEYKSLCLSLLNYISVYIIATCPRINGNQKIKLLSLKSNSDISNEVIFRNGSLFYENMPIYNFNKDGLLTIDFINVKNNTVYIEGNIKYSFDMDDFDVFAKVGDKMYKLNYFYDTFDNQTVLNEQYLKVRYFNMEIPLIADQSIKFILNYKTFSSIKISPLLSKFTGIKTLNQYRVDNGYIIKIKNSKLIITKNSIKKHLAYEKNYVFTLLKKGEYKSLIYRMIYYILKCFKRKPIWIVSDRPYVANDNGEALFEFFQTVETDAKIYFTISKDSKDYKRMKNIGKIVPYNSKKYKFLFLLSDLIISSQASDSDINAFGRRRVLINDLYNFKFVFLQHGITKDDLSEWLKKPNKNIKIFVTSVIPEFDSIVNNKNYMYSKDVVKLTGLPRYDKLNNNTQKKIIFMPTWRHSLAPEVDAKTGKRVYNELFKESEYCKFYNKIINDKRILDLMKQNGYIGEFFIHPSHSSQTIDFIGNDIISVSNETANYTKEFSEGCLLVTDFSSVAMDFAYLKKPVIYSQFDKETFFEGAVYDEGYFSYEDDGFGPVCYDYESTVNAIIKAIENDCKNEQKYIKRIDKFFKYTDKNNSKRVYEEIKKLK